MSEPIADAHLHICKADMGFGVELTFTWKDLFDLFMNTRLERAAVIPMNTNTGSSIETNEQFFKEVVEFELRDKIWPYYWPHPTEVDFEFVERNEISGIKFHPSISQTTIDNAHDVLKIAHDKGVPLLVHCGRNEMSRMSYLLAAAKKEPDITYIGAHVGGLANDLILAALRLIDEGPRNDNLYLDTSGCMNPKILHRAIDVMGSDRILWGTDLPFFDFEITKLVLDRTGIDSKAKRKILFDNAMSIHK
jgi:predicted TIM-barrel fold metal-dependent hydrolase